MSYMNLVDCLPHKEFPCSRVVWMSKWCVKAHHGFNILNSKVACWLSFHHLWGHPSPTIRLKHYAYLFNNFLAHQCLCYNWNNNHLSNWWRLQLNVSTKYLKTHQSQTFLLHYPIMGSVRFFLCPCLCIFFSILWLGFKLIKNAFII